MNADLTTSERVALMSHLLTGRDLFAGSKPRVAEWFSDRLCELDDDHAEEHELLEQLLDEDQADDAG